MADMELIIKLDEEEYINIKNAINSLIENGVERASMSKVCLSILDGTPLPKGHGDLVDISPYKGKVICSHLYSGVKKLIEVDSIEPIIEADKEASDTE